MLEQSNVNVVDEFVNMILAQRSYESNSRVIKAADEMLQQEFEPARRRLARGCRCAGVGLSVICLQNGITGQTIRATSKDHTVVYTAEVVDGGLLKGRL
jgi:hypothetical protein